MKKGMRRVLVAVLSFAMILLCAAPAMAEEAPAGGTIMWLSNLTAGLQYESSIAFAEKICNELGYQFQIVYGDGFNDAAGNLQAVKNAMTSDVVGLIASQDGGLAGIMEEYPELYVVGYNSDMRTVFTEGEANTACLESDHFLGTIGDGPIDGAKIGEEMAEQVIGKGYKKIATVTFPGFAYPSFVEADAALRAIIEEYNASAEDAEKITIVGDATVLMFTPLEDSWFLEDGHADLDALVGFCDGNSFVYPVLKTAIINGICSPATQLISRGLSDDADINADVGENGTIGALYIPPTENIGWCIAMIDSAVSGNMYSDFTAAEQVDGVDYVIDSEEDMQNVMEKSLIGTADAENAQITMEDLQSVMTRFNPDATYAQLKDLFASEKLFVEYLAQ